MRFVLKSAAAAGALALMLALAPLAQAHEPCRRDPCPPPCPPPCPVVVCPAPPCPVVVCPPVQRCYVPVRRVEPCRVVRCLPRHRERCR